MCNYAIFLGLRLTLRPRLYAAARIRGLRTRQNVGNDKRVKPGVARCSAPPRLDSIACIRGLGFDTRISRKSLGNDKALKRTAKVIRSLRDQRRPPQGAA